MFEGSYKEQIKPTRTAGMVEVTFSWVLPPDPHNIVGMINPLLSVTVVFAVVSRLAIIDVAFIVDCLFCFGYSSEKVVLIE